MSRRRAHAHPCPTATKTAYSSEEEAQRVLDYLATVPTFELDGPRPVRHYRCECRRWHLTSRSQSYAEIAERLVEARVLRYEALPDQWRDVDTGDVVFAESMPDAEA